MRPWRVRLAVRRSRVQWAFLAVVLAVSVLAATLLATLYLLAAATETFAARTALTEASAQDVALTLDVEPNAPVDDILGRADDMAADLFGDVPYARSVNTQGSYLSVPREDRPFAFAYLGSSDQLDDLVMIRSGQAPQAAGSGPVQIIVPPAFLYDIDGEVGDTLTLAPYATSKDLHDYLIVGTYTVKDVEDPAWLYDRYLGTTHNPNTIVPFTGGRVTTDGYGPLYTVQEDVEVAPLESVVVTYTPDFSTTSLEEVTAVVGRTGDLERTAIRSLGDSASSVDISTRLNETLGNVAGSLAVTRSSVLVTGLLLLVLAIAALSQTARLMAERRYAEQHLMVARGGSGRQLFRLGFIEAIALGAATTLAAAPLARLAYLALARTQVMQDAGMDIDPGIPPLTWVVTGIVGVILIIILVAPLMRRQGTFVDAEQARSRPGRRAAFQRSGLDLAVLALAILAYWQLKNYRSPVLASGSVATVDPLLAAGPALALLAGALVAVRLIPPASKVLEAIAARGRRAVLPLAAWEVGRRAARAVSAILLLTLAVSIGTFSVTFLTSWHQSQDDQALYRHPPAAIVTDVPGPWLSQRAQVAVGDNPATASAVVEQAAKLGMTPQGFQTNTFAGAAVTLVATDTAGLKTYGVGRLNEIAGARVASTVGGDVPAEVDPIEIPGKPQQLALDVNARATQDMGDVQLQLRGVIRNDFGDYQTVWFGQIPLDGEDYHLTGQIAMSADLENYSTPMYLVGLQATWVSLDGGEGAVIDETRPLALEVSIDNVAAETPTLTVPAPDVPSVVDSTPLDIPAELDWTVSNNGVGVDSLSPVKDQIHMRVIASPSGLTREPVSLVLTAADTASPVRIVATSSAMKDSNLELDTPVSIEVMNTVLPAYIAERVPALAGDTLGKPAVATNIANLQVAMVQAGGNVINPREWWVDLGDTAAADYASALPEEAALTTQAGLAEDLKTDPLRVAIQAALWLVTGAAVVLAALGFAVHAIVTVRAREIELAQMRAIGVLRGQLLRIVASENALLSFLGLVFGVGLGVALSYLVAPLVSVGPDGRPPTPSVVVEIPWEAVGLLALEVAAVLLVSVIIVSIMLRRIKPAEMLRLGDER
ncbi:ABC transporter permease [Demequina sp.]|uniref:ABC transporter permease n=1 Tax=Demequina sp. TaxID=2050685 RepID=UPI003D13793C